MITNIIYRTSIEKAIPLISIKDGNVLVTGASGLIGSCIVDLLLLSNEHGRKFCVYAMGRSLDKLKKRFAAFDQSESLHFIEQDVCTPFSEDISFDYIVHGASNADPKSYALYPVKTMLTIINGTQNVLEYCKKHCETKALILSTFEVYGNTEKDVYKESDYGVVDLNQLRSCYPESKRCAELMTRCYETEYGINVVIGRLCSIYGPTMTKNDSKAHAQFIKNALMGEDIVLKSKGEPIRTYCYVIDAVTGLLCVLDKGQKGEAYNISNDKSIASIAEVAQTVATIAGKQVIFRLPDDIEKKGFSKPQNCILDNSKLINLGWRGNYTLEKGLNDTIEILKESLF